MYIHTITLILLFTQTLCFTLICFIAFYVILLFLTRIIFFFFFFSSRRRHTRSDRDWSSDGALPISRRSRGTHPPRHAVRPGLRRPRSGTRTRCPRPGRPRPSRRRRTWPAARTGRPPVPVKREPARPDRKSVV